MLTGTHLAAGSAALLALAVLVLPGPRARVSRGAAPVDHARGRKPVLPARGGVTGIARGVLRLDWPVLAVVVLGLGGCLAVVVGPAVGIAGAVVLAVAVRGARDLVAERELTQALEVDLAVCEALIAELQSGAALSTAMRASASRTGDLPDALRHAASAVAVGGRPADVLSASRSATARRLGGLFAIAVDRGIAPAAAIEALRADLLHRREHRHRLAGLLAGPSTSAALLAGLPVLGLLMGQGMGADPLTVLTGTTAGGVALVAGAALTAVGVVWTRRIVNAARAAA